MHRLLLCSVGTSLLTGPGRPWKWNPREAGEFPPPAMVEGWLKFADLVQASAETNTLERMEVGRYDRIVFLHSDTPEGAYCAERLAAFYRARCRDVGLERIAQLGYGAKSFSRGLKALIDITCRLVREARENRAVSNVVICATGGFKAEIAYLNLLGALLHVEVVYIHELHRDLVSLPTLPLAWDGAFTFRNKDFFEWIEQEPRRSEEVESWLKAEPLLRSLVEDGGDGYTYLSPAGYLLYLAGRELEAAGEPVEWPEPSPVLPKEKDRVSNEPHERPDGWERYVKRLCDIAYVTSVRYDEKLHWGERVRILDPDHGTIGVRFESRGKRLPMRVETTARGREQTELVADYIRRIR